MYGVFPSRGPRGFERLEHRSLTQAVDSSRGPQRRFDRMTLAGAGQLHPVGQRAANNRRLSASGPIAWISQSVTFPFD
jgi:hypothetical protein